LGSFDFNYAVTISVKTLTLTIDLSAQNCVTSRISQGHSLHQVWTLGSFVFEWLCCGQTNRRPSTCYPCRPTYLAWV